MKKDENEATQLFRKQGREMYDKYYTEHHNLHERGFARIDRISPQKRKNALGVS